MMNYTAVKDAVARELHVGPLDVFIVGSTLICDKGNDLDILCLINSDARLEAAGFVRDIEIEYETPLRSWRHGNINIIAVADRAFYLAEIAIAMSAKVIRATPFDMKRREDRVAFHSTVRDVVLRYMNAGDLNYDDI